MTRSNFLQIKEICVLWRQRSCEKYLLNQFKNKYNWLFVSISIQLNKLIEIIFLLNSEGHLIIKFS